MLLTLTSNCKSAVPTIRPDSYFHATAACFAAGSFLRESLIEGILWTTKRFCLPNRDIGLKINSALETIIISFLLPCYWNRNTFFLSHLHGAYECRKTTKSCPEMPKTDHPAVRRDGSSMGTSYHEKFRRTGQVLTKRARRRGKGLTELTVTCDSNKEKYKKGLPIHKLAYFYRHHHHPLSSPLKNLHSTPLSKCLLPRSCSGLLPPQLPLLCLPSRT